MSVVSEIKEQSSQLAKKAGDEIRKHPVAAAALTVTAMGLISYAATLAWRASHNGRPH